MSFDPKQPYNDLPLLPPAIDLETKSVLKRCVANNKALAELKGAGDLIPNHCMSAPVFIIQRQVRHPTAPLPPPPDLGRLWIHPNNMSKNSEFLDISREYVHAADISRTP